MGIFMRFNHSFCFIILLLTAACKEDAAVQLIEPSEIVEPETKVVTVQLDLSKFPEPCRPYVKYLTDSENPSRFMAQIEQESTCDPYALSRTGAIGLVQIMPDTLKWGARTFARHLGEADAHDPIYAIEFLKAYMDYFTVDLFDDYCSNKTVDEARYNGGFYIIWEIRHSDGTLAGAESVCGVERLENGKMRSLSNCRENYGYSRHIARRQTKYLVLGGKHCPAN